LSSTTKIAGTAVVDRDGNWQYGPPREALDLKALPITTYREFNLKDYDCHELIIEWSRGCIGNCNFCKAKELDGSLRTYSVDNVIDSLKFYRDNYGINEFTVCDLAVNGNVINLERICDRLIAEVPGLKIKAEALPLRKMNENILKKMKAAGFVEIQWGVETGSDRVLELMGKKVFFTASDSQEVIRASYLAGIKTATFCIVGYPGETEEDFRKTREFIDRNAEYIDVVKSINSLHIITGTRVHKDAEKLGIKLPETDYHYLWEMPDNNIEVRQRRIRELLELIKIKKIPCLETNLLEGRQNSLFQNPEKNGLSMEKRVGLLREAINSLIDYRANANENLSQLSNPRADFLRDNAVLLGVFHGKKAFHGPECVEIDLSHNCNFNCIGCWCHCDHLQELKTPNQKRKQHLPLDLIRLLIDDLVELGTSTIQLAGPGEPFTHPDIMEIIRYIKGNGLELHIITNGSYIDFAIAEELCHLKVDLITVSVWAGSEEVFTRLHPNQGPERFQQLKETLTFFGNYKKYSRYPRIKIFNVINSYNAADITNMVNFGLEVRADQMEFTVVDTIPGKTDFLALGVDDLQNIEEQFAGIVAQATYPDPPGRKHLAGLSPEQMEEHYEVNARFFTDIGDYKGFHYEAEKKVMTCKEGFSNREMVHDPFLSCANIFYFDPEICRKCKSLEKCEIDKTDFSIKTRFFAVLGFGSFVRRARLSVLQKEGEEGLKKISDIPETPFVDTMPCTIGWTYSRISTAGDVLPCCKGYGKIMGNLYKNGFKHIWNGGNLMEFRQKAKNFRKSDPYFDIIDCYKSCDNIGQNMGIMKKMRNLKPREKMWLEDEARKMG
jgi:MoaA/NifB/PqqE/SkfB family radical SAM enzyme